MSAAARDDGFGFAAGAEPAIGCVVSTIVASSNAGGGSGALATGTDALATVAGALATAAADAAGVAAGAAASGCDADVASCVSVFAASGDGMRPRPGDRTTSTIAACT